MDHHTIAAVSITGTCLDLVGSLYLAYDLLGGQHGPLRLLTRAVTYSVVFGIGYGLGLGLFFGLFTGVASGVTIAIELNRAARGLEHYSFWGEGLFSVIRAVAFGACLYPNLGLGFAAAFAILLTLGQILAYSRGMRPALDYALQASRASPAGTPGESSSGRLATPQPHWCAARSCSALTMCGRLRFGWDW